MFKSLDNLNKTQVKLSEPQLAEKIKRYIQEIHFHRERALQAKEEAKQIAKITQQAKEKAQQAREEARQAKERTRLARVKAQCLVNRAEKLGNTSIY